MARPSEFRWVVPPADVFPQMSQAYIQRVRQAVYTLCQFYAPQIEADMKASAPWTDRTGNARQTLSAAAQEVADAILIEMGYGVDYGIYLEHKNSGRYAILAPTVDKFGPIVMQGIQRLLR